MTTSATRREGWKKYRFRHPAQVLVAAFGSAVLVGTLLLLLPVCRAGAHGADALTALFTATSAVCVTGLTVVDTEHYWSTTGQAVILALVQVGGFGLMTLASLLALFVSRRLGLRTRLNAAVETKSVGLGDVRTVVRGVFVISLVAESLTAAVLTGRLVVEGQPVRHALWLGGFHAVSAFNNAGFSLYSDSLTRYLTDGWVLLPVSLAVIVGGLGFPVVLELSKRTRPRRWSLHTKLTLTMTAILLVGGTLFMTLSEWDNAATIGTLDPLQKVLAGFFHAVQPRTAGFNAWDYGQVSQETLLGTVLLMFVGGGSASTAGGLKVTTFILLFFVIVAEVRGEPQVTAFDRRVEPRVIRQALTVALLGIAAVVGATMLLTELTDFPIPEVMFEATSAFATVGLSTGLTPHMGAAGQLVLVFLMFVGRLGPITLVSALALREHARRYSLPEGAPIIG
ncbi:TrkH family potassium uptake protein [Phycicoccus endophyticus]|uniref:TrkH family potassium uptake protein n=1 Tax=Phycicoccus endophyticus TaxID=1690220 RepID=A0A7G9R3K5_9MICO|nr:potassium transporter TrkG [Phycicoccus endophyticus]NHI19937.1 TrkH family potassium uptake protein [Phycicoccus endophyticus]QNN50180.1 TrkH family potassium uptake protein [Phycicoccus endophyticus]GGL27361.1 potassium transporter Trk [Phycicoccus endophyticus]